jgi:thiol-disulfide isomerase/thioredoxin
MKKIGFYIFCLGAMIFPKDNLHAQEQKVRWLTFKQLQDSLAVKPKKVFIDFYAEWCAYCKKMEQATYKNLDVISKLNQEYYAVKMDAESRDTILFDGKKFKNKSYGKKRNAVHDIPLLLASREGAPFSLPAIVLLDESFRVTNRYFEYIAPKKMLSLLEN